MRVFLICLLTTLLWTTETRAKDDKGGGAPLPRLQDNWKNYKVEIPGAKEKKSFEFPETYELPNANDFGTTEEYGQKKFGKWWFSNSYPGDKCHLRQTAEGWQTIFLAFEPYMTYYVVAKTPDVLSLYVPSQPHPKGTPVVFVDSRSFALAPQTAKTFVPPNPQAQRDMVQAMKSGKIMIVKWVDGDGARREDRYPLTGFAEAFAELSRRNCPSSGSS
jgi:hypothetical protein